MNLHQRLNCSYEANVTIVVHGYSMIQINEVKCPVASYDELKIHYFIYMYEMIRLKSNKVLVKSMVKLTENPKLLKSVYAIFWS